MIKPELLVPQINTVGLVAHYKLWAGLTTTGEVFDYSLGGATGTVTGTDIAPTYPGFSFNGTDDFIDVGNQGGAIKTVAIWIKPTTIIGFDHFIGFDGGTSFIFIEDGSIDVGGITGDTSYIDGIVNDMLTAGKWQLSSLTFDAVTASDLDIGRVEGQGLFTGKIGDTMFFDRVLSAVDVKNIYSVTRWRYGV